MARGIQYTLRDVPAGLDQVLRGKVRSEGKSLNRVVIELLSTAVGLSETQTRHHDLDDLAGAWVHDPDCEAALDAMDVVDQDMWR